jgi:hypothetical protein
VISAKTDQKQKILSKVGFINYLNDQNDRSNFLKKKSLEFPTPLKIVREFMIG